MSALSVHRLGLVEYEDGLALQQQVGEARAADLIPDTLLLLQHPPVLTLGRAAKKHHILAPPEVLAREGVEVFETNRGGDVTYHGPGQVVGYPIFRLPPGRQDVRRYVRDLEECVVVALRRFGIEAGRIPRWTGVWLGQEGTLSARKIAAIGVHISRWRTSHGFALNVNTNLAHFGLIVPCGIKEGAVTSMAAERGQPVLLAAVEQALIEAFSSVFDLRATVLPPQLRTVSVTVVGGSPEQPRVLLLQRRPDQGGFWQQVTGRIEPAERPEQAAARELLEETGLDLPVRSLEYEHALGIPSARVPTVCVETAFAVRCAGQPSPRLSPEHVEHCWATPDEASRLVPYAGLRRAIERATRPPVGA